MKAKLIELYSPTIDDLANYIPENVEKFCIFIQVFVGIEGQKGEESFDLNIFTPKWLLSNYKKNEIIIPKHSIIVFEYNFERIFHKIKQLIESCSGNSWDEIAQKVGQIGRWEFEDYQE